jgi:hypothetical protein
MAASTNQGPSKGNGRNPPDPATSDVFDNLDRLRLDPAASLISTTVHLPHVAARKPKPHEFFRVHPDPEMSLTTIAYRDEVEREHYLVLPDAAGLLIGFARPVCIVTCLSRQNTLFLWPVPMPTEDGGRGHNAWHSTARQAAEMAKTQWVSLRADMAAGCYQVHAAAGTLSEPTWPPKSFSELLRLAFSKRMISDGDHPIIHQLLGLT